MKLTTKEIMEIIPHRHPFLLIDTIEELVPGVKATGKKCVTGSCGSVLRNVLPIMSRISQDTSHRNRLCREF